MVLQKFTQLGLTYGQIISLLALLSSGVAAWVNLTNQTTANSTRISALESDKARIELNVGDLIKDNKSDHKLLMSKIDDNNKLIIDYLRKIKR
ncbi:MAG: hypothetical protein ACOYMF_17600 [Bacteroidales bacterium]